VIEVVVVDSRSVIASVACQLAVKINTASELVSREGYSFLPFPPHHSVQSASVITSSVDHSLIRRYQTATRDTPQLTNHGSCRKQASKQQPSPEVACRFHFFSATSTPRLAFHRFAFSLSRARRGRALAALLCQWKTRSFRSNMAARYLLRTKRSHCP